MLTKKQTELLTTLLEHEAEFGYAPSLTELCKALSIKSQGSLLKRVKALTQLGYVEPLSYQQRGVRLTKKAKEQRTVGQDAVPYVGVIAAGKPIEAIEQRQFMTLPDILTTQLPCYVLKVQGDSMIELGILEGDYVIIEQRSYAKNGEIVVALINHTDATLKTIEQYPHEVWLIPANSSMAVQRYAPHQVEIQGVVVGQMRSYRTL